MVDKVEHQSYRRKKHFQLAAGIALFLCLTTVIRQVDSSPTWYFGSFQR